MRPHQRTIISLAAAQAALLCSGLAMAQTAPAPATGDKALFDMKSNTVTLEGNVVVSQGQNVMRGERLVVDLTTGTSRVDAGKSNGPVRVLIQQGGSPDGKGSAPGLGGLGPKFGPQKQN